MDDLISRQAAIGAVGYYCLHSGDRLLFADKALKDIPSAQQWHVITKRPMTDDERKEWSERLGYDLDDDEAFIFGNLPDDGEEVFVSTQYGRVYIDTFCQDDGCYFEENGDMDGIVAWMPLPAPYKESE